MQRLSWREEPYFAIKSYLLRLILFLHFHQTLLILPEGAGDGHGSGGTAGSCRQPPSCFVEPSFCLQLGVVVNVKTVVSVEAAALDWWVGPGRQLVSVQKMDSSDVVLSKP